MLFVQNKNEGYKEYIKFKYSKSTSDYYYYENTCFVCKTGDRTSGHYFINRKKNNKWLKISDSHTSYLSKYDLPRKMPLFCLYEYRGKRKWSKLLIEYHLCKYYCTLYLFEDIRLSKAIFSWWKTINFQRNLIFICR